MEMCAAFWKCGKDAQINQLRDSLFTGKISRFSPLSAHAQLIRCCYCCCCRSRRCRRRQLRPLFNQGNIDVVSPASWTVLSFHHRPLIVFRHASVNYHLPHLTLLFQSSRNSFCLLTNCGCTLCTWTFSCFANRRHQQRTKPVAFLKTSEFSFFQATNLPFVQCPRHTVPTKMRTMSSLQTVQVILAEKCLPTEVIATSTWSGHSRWTPAPLRWPPRRTPSSRRTRRTRWRLPPRGWPPLRRPLPPNTWPVAGATATSRAAHLFPWKLNSTRRFADSFGSFHCFSSFWCPSSAWRRKRCSLS